MGPSSAVSGIVTITIVILKLSFLWQYLLLSFPHLVPIIVDGIAAVVICAVVTVIITVDCRRRWKRQIPTSTIQNVGRSKINAQTTINQFTRGIHR